MQRLIPHALPSPTPLSCASLLQVAGQRSRLSALSSELRRLQSQCAVLSPHHQSMQLSFEALGSARRLLGRLSQLIVQLSEEGAALVQGWGAQEETWR